MSHRRKLAALRPDGRFLPNLGADFTVLAGCGVLSVLLSLLVGSPVLLTLIMGCASTLAVVYTRSILHGLLTAIPASFISVWVLTKDLRHPVVVFFLLLLISTALSFLVGNILYQLNDNLYEMKKKYKQEKLIDDINQRILTSRTTDSLELLTLESLCELTGKPGVVYRQTSEGVQSICLIPRWQLVYPSELSAAEMAFATGERCGLGTNYFASSSYLYIPIISQGKILAVAAIRFGVDNHPNEEMLNHRNPYSGFQRHVPLQ